MLISFKKIEIKFSASNIDILNKNKKPVTRRELGYGGTMKLTPDRITDYKAPSAEEVSTAKQAAKRQPIVNYPGEGFREMTKAEWAKMPGDYKAVRGVVENETHGAYRFRR